MVYFDKGTKELIEKFNNVPLVWEEDYTGFVFQVKYSDLLEGLIELSSQFEIDTIVTLDTFFKSILTDYQEYDAYKHYHPDIRFDAGWNYECFSSYGWPIINVFITHRIDGNQVIFTIQLGNDGNYYRGPCDTVLDCMGYAPNCG